jgi:hypothetical protein
MLIKNHYPRLLGSTTGDDREVGRWDFVRRGGIIPDLSGNGLDLDTWNGVSFPAPGHGTQWKDDVTCSVQANAGPDMTIPDGSHTVVAEFEDAPGGTRYVADVRSALAAGHWDVVILNTGNVGQQYGAGVVYYNHSFVGRGPSWLTIAHIGANTTILDQGRVINAGAFATGGGALGRTRFGAHGILRGAIMRRAQLTAAEDRALCVDQWGRQIQWAWRPTREGVTHAGGIATNDTFGDWHCPLGGANLKFEWIDDLSHPDGGYLALTDDGALAMRRIQFPFRRPLFGTFRWRYIIRDNTTDNPIMGFVGERDNDPTAAGAGSGYVQSQNAAGAWQTTLHRDNGAAMITISHALPANGSVVDINVTRHTEGVWRMGVAVNGEWLYNDAAAVADVTYLLSPWIVLVPRGSYILQHVRHQGEMTPMEAPPWP